MKLSNYLWALVAVAGIAQGACPAVVPSSRACVSWQPSLTWSSGVPYAAGTVVTYHVFSSDGNGGGQLLATTTATDVTIPGLPPGEQCFVVFAMVGVQQSGPSNIACKVIRFAGPSDGSIAGPTDGSIEPSP
jgi:hypothetical protein